MVEHLNNTFHALADPTRREILSMLVKKDLSTIKDLADPFPISLAAISKHIHVLERAELVQRFKTGRTNYLRINPEPLKEVQNWLKFNEAYWHEKFENLETIINADLEKQKKVTP